MRIIPKGFTLIEITIAMGIIGGSVATALFYQSRAEQSDRAQKTITAIDALVSDVKTIWGYNDLVTVTAASINSSGLVPVGFRYESPYLRDPAGEAVLIDGWRNNLAVRLGPMPTKNCMTVAAGLVSVATKISVGAPTMAGGGTVGGEHIYKNGVAVDQAALMAGCALPAAKVALEIHV